VGLLDLQTDLKTLKYGNRSLTSFPFEEPFVTVDIPATNEPLPVYPINIQTNIGQIVATAFKNNLINLGNSLIPGPGAPTQNPPKLEFTIKGPQAGTGGPDFLLRGGLLFPTIVARDVLRIAKTLASTNGLLFIAKQKILQGTGLKPEYLQNTGIGNRLLNLVIGRDQYNPINTLAQVGVVGLGGHLPRDGKTSNLLTLKLGSIQGGDFEPNKYIDYINNQQTPSLLYPTTSLLKSSNRLLRFYEVNQVRVLTGAPPQAIANANFLYQSIGGPDSLLGIGTTKITTTKARTGFGNLMLGNDNEAGQHPFDFYLTYAQHDIYNAQVVGRYNKQGILVTKPGDFVQVLKDNYSANVYVPPTISELTGSIFIQNLMTPSNVNAGKKPYDLYLTYSQKQIVASGGREAEIRDFRRVLREGRDTKNFFEGVSAGKSAPNLTILSPSPDYSNPENRIEQRTLLGDPGNKSRLLGVKGYSDPKLFPTGTGSIAALDQITASEIYDSEGVKPHIAKDLVNFVIEGVDNDTPNQSQFIHFRAFLGPISDNYTAEWSNIRYVGRGEKFYSYQGFDRSISLSWVVAAQSYGELGSVNAKINRLVSFTAPDYGTNGYMRAPIVRLTIGTIYQRLPGIITQISYEIDTNETSWELGLKDGATYEDRQVGYYETPTMFKVSTFNFIPLHQFAPRKATNSRQVPFLGQPVTELR